MFTVRATCKDAVEIAASAERVREFFSRLANFVELMPNIESIHTNGKGITHWMIKAPVPVVGTLRQSFAVELEEDTVARIEWVPAKGEAQNLLRYAAEFEHSNGITKVTFSQFVELRRKSARELHALAPFAGESAISKGIQAEVSAMIRTFVERAKERLDRI
jgi:uncharacterized membrane protein